MWEEEEQWNHHNAVVVAPERKKGGSRSHCQNECRMFHSFINSKYIIVFDSRFEYVQLRNHFFMDGGMDRCIFALGKAVFRMN